MITNSLPKFSVKEIVTNLFTTNRYFQIGLILKISLAALFASAYLSDLFAPFIKLAVYGNFWNVYNDYYQVNPRAFPYPPLMLYILALPRFIFSLLGQSVTGISLLDIFSIKIPLLIADFLVLVVLIKWIRRYKEVVIWYWLNPIVIYISYVHGQLDIIPTSFLCLSLYFLFSHRPKFAILFLAFACATKFHIMMTVPLILIYIYKTGKFNISQLLIGGLIFGVLLFALNLPFLFEPGFIKMVYQNPEQSKVLSSYFPIIDNYRIILIPACYFIVLYIMMGFRFANKDMLIVLLALSFGITTFFIVPRQGWYLWNMPFFVYFMLRFNLQGRMLFIALNIAYFIFFIISPESDFPYVAQFIFPVTKDIPNLFLWLKDHNINSGQLVQIAFTLLQTTLLLYCISIFRMGIWNLKQYKIYQEPYLIGIGGDSSTGKTTLSEAISDLFGSVNTLLVHGDDMHRWERGHEKWKELTHLDPKANWLHRDLSQMIDLKKGKKILRRTYDHETGKFESPVAFYPNKLIIYEGLHSFYLKEAARTYDLKIFLKPSEELRRNWKIERDVTTRGHARNNVLASIEKRMPDAENHIQHQEAEADIVFSTEKIQHDEALITSDEENVRLRVVCSNDIYFEPLIDYLNSGRYGVDVQHQISKLNQTVLIQGSISNESLQEIAENLQLDIEEVMGSAPQWRGNYFGIMQIFVLFFILHQFRKTGNVIGVETL